MNVTSLFDLSGKVALVTGASRGIGESIAKLLAQSGAHVIVSSRKIEGCQQVVDDIISRGGSAQAIACHIGDMTQIESLFNNIESEHSKLDILVNNAGFAIYGSVSDLSVDEIESQMETNYFGMVYCIKNFLPTMIDKKSGHIVNVASVAASFGLPGIASYCASKFAMLGFSEGLKHELKNSGVGITVVSPIMVRTNFFEHPSFEKMPKFSPTSLSSKTVAKAILKAANSPRLEIIVPSVVRGAVWLKNTFPYFINPILGKAFKKQLDFIKKD